MRSPGIDAYRRQQLESMRPEQLVLVALEQGICACRSEDRRRARRAVQVLIGGLDFEYEIGGRLLTIYDWVFRLLREGKFADAEQVLTELHMTWQQACGVHPTAADQASGLHAEHSGQPYAGPPGPAATGGPSPGGGGLLDLAG